MTTLPAAESTALLLFGGVANDEKGRGGDDALVAVVENPVGFTCNCQISNRVFIHTNGYITLDSNFESAKPALLKSGNSQKIVAPFWSDIDLKNDSKIWYHLYNKFDSTDVSLIMSEVKSLVRGNFRESSVADSFEPNTVLVVTWENVVQSPARLHETQNATFQLLLASDGLTTYTGFLYKAMHFLPPKKAVMGYRCGESSRSIFNLPGSLTPSIYSEVINKGDNAKNTKGLWMYKLDTCSNSDINYVERCHNWRITSARGEQEMTSLAHGLLASCPCNVRQMQADPRFMASTEEPGCYFKVHSPGDYLFTRKCCYSTSSPEGPLLTGVSGAGYVYLYNPLLYPSLSLSHDVTPYTWCCVKAGLCDLFFNQRPSDNCLSYKPPESGISYGDPHIDTIDGYSYTYNGIGEYTMLEIRNISSEGTVFELQSRTSLAQNISGSQVPASIFSAFVAKEDNVTAQVEVNLQKNGMIVFCNGLDVTNEFYQDMNYICTIHNQLRLSRKSQLSNHSVQILFASEIALTISFNVEMLDLTVLVPTSLSNVTSIGGLLGNVNGNSTDDLTLKNGSVLPETPTERDIYSIFGESWRIDCNESIFYYRAGEDCNMYQNTSFTPMFLEDFNSTRLAEANKTCKGERGCLFDFLITGNQAIADNSKRVMDIEVQRQLEAENNPPEIKGQLKVNATLGQSLNLSADAFDPDGDLVTVISPDGNSTGSGTANISYIYTPTAEHQQISFWAVDMKGSASHTLTVVIVKCSGCSGHGDCDFDHPTPTSQPNQLSVPCICHIGWEGESCSVDIDGCHDDPCVSPSVCSDNSPEEHNNTSVAYKCDKCIPGYIQGNEKKCVDVDECVSGSQCGVRQQCTNVEGSFSCSCQSGYRSDPNQDLECLDVNECLEQTSECEQLCNNTEGGYVCSCRESYILSQDNKTCQQDIVPVGCTNFGCSHICVVESNSPRCYCKDGFTLAQDGKTCSDIDECLEVTGKKCPQLCTNTEGGYTCSCVTGFQLMDDQKSCTECDTVHWGVNCNQSCDCTQNSISCDSKFGCQCKDGWSGTHCEVNIDECVGGGPCGGLENCEDTPGSYVCQCKAGYLRNQTTGNCENINECKESLYNCTVLEVCADTLGSYRCDCLLGYQREASGQCRDVNECELQTDECNHHCINTEGSYNCKCNIGYLLQDNRRTCVKSSNPCEGSSLSCDENLGGCTTNTSGSPYCFCPQGYRLNQTSNQCTDINECADIAHVCSDLCNNTAGGFHCSCTPGNGLLADKKTCQSCNKTDSWGIDCENQCGCGVGALYCDSLGGCVCEAGWTGAQCSTDIDECYNSSTNKCGENSHCVNREPSYICQCDPGYTKLSNSQSTQCTDINECETNQHDCSQRCYNTDGGFLCSCSDGFILDADNKTCHNLDECTLKSDDCQQICVDTLGSFFCQCHTGFHLADDQRTCVQDLDPCNAAKNCSYACRIKDGNPECYCSSNSRLNPQNNETCVAIDNKIPVNMTTDYPFLEDLLHPPTAIYKNTKKDFEDSLRKSFREIPGFENVVPVVTKFRKDAAQSGNTTVEFYLVMDRDVTPEDIANVSSALVNLRRSKISVRLSKYNILREPTVGTSQEPAQCVLCPQSCYFHTASEYLCRSSLDEEKTLMVQLSLERDFDPALNDSRSPGFKEYSDKIASSLGTILTLTNIEEIYVSEFREISNSKTQIVAHVSLNTSVTESVRRTVGRTLYQTVDSKKCLDLDPSCVALNNQTYIGNSTSLIAVICYTCSAQQICVKATNEYQCVAAPATTVTTPAQTEVPSNIDLILGLGLGLPLGLILSLLVLLLMCLPCRRRRRARRSSTDSEFSSVDPYHIRAAFGSVSSKISGHKPQEFGGLGVGMFGASPFGQQPRDIIDSQRQQQEFPELPFSYGNRFYRPEGDTFNESSYFESRREDLPPSSNFSWDFLFNTLDPKEEFRIDRPSFAQTPTAPYMEDFGSEA